MKVAIHQPNFLPWMGYFYKIARCDCFVFYDEAEYTQKSFIRRVLIHKEDPDQEMFLTVPLRKHSSFDKISDLIIVEQADWIQKAKAQIHQAYHRAPFYYQLEPIMDIFLDERKRVTSLARYNGDMIMYLADLLGCTPSWVWSSDLHITSSSTHAVVEMINQLHGTAYISGLGAQKYHDLAVFDRHHIDLIYPDFPRYFHGSGFPPSFQYKSIISYLAHYDRGRIAEWIKDGAD